MLNNCPSPFTGRGLGWGSVQRIFIENCYKRNNLLYHVKENGVIALIKKQLPHEVSSPQTNFKTCFIPAFFPRLLPLTAFLKVNQDSNSSNQFPILPRTEQTQDNR